MRPYKMQIRTFLRDGVPTYQTVATKGKEVIPFWYNGDIIYLGLGSKHPQHDRDFGIVQECLFLCRNRFGLGIRKCNGVIWL